MNYFDIINECLLELNFKKQAVFSDLTKTEHTKIKELVNRVNQEICSSFDWWFRQRSIDFEISASQIEHENTINGRITHILIDGIEYFFEADYEKFYKNSAPGGKYSFYCDKILFPNFDAAKTAKVFYLTNDFAKAEEGANIAKMSTETDTSIIPETFQESLLVYGTCVRFKAMPNNPKFQHWYGEYIKALRNLKSQGDRAQDEAPKIVISRRGR